MTCPQLSYPRDSGSDYPLHILLVSAGISRGMCLYRGEPCTMRVHTDALTHTLIQPSAPRARTTPPSTDLPGSSPEPGSRGMQRQAGKGLSLNSKVCNSPWQITFVLTD